MALARDWTKAREVTLGMSQMRMDSDESSDSGFTSMAIVNNEENKSVTLQQALSRDADRCGGVFQHPQSIHNGNGWTHNSNNHVWPNNANGWPNASNGWPFVNNNNNGWPIVNNNSNVALPLMNNSNVWPSTPTLSNGTSMPWGVVGHQGYVGLVASLPDMRHPPPNYHSMMPTPNVTNALNSIVGNNLNGYGNCRRNGFVNNNWKKSTHEQCRRNNSRNNEFQRKEKGYTVDASSVESLETGLIDREERLRKLTDETGYPVVQRNGQRIYGGPPPNWSQPAPSKGCEVFVGRVPRDCFEDELVPVFSSVGKIYELRLMMDFSGTNRGYLFVRYTCEEDAMSAIRKLNGYEIRSGRKMGVTVSIDNRRLWVSGIPNDKSAEEIQEEMLKLTPHVVNVVVSCSRQRFPKNRAFCFVEYENHRAAALARRALVPNKFRLFGSRVEKVDWADPFQP